MAQGATVNGRESLRTMHADEETNFFLGIYPNSAHGIISWCGIIPCSAGAGQRPAPVKGAQTTIVGDGKVLERTCGVSSSVRLHASQRATGCIGTCSGFMDESNRKCMETCTSTRQQRHVARPCSAEHVAHSEIDKERNAVKAVNGNLRAMVIGPVLRTGVIQLDRLTALCADNLAVLIDFPSVHPAS